MSFDLARLQRANVNLPNNASEAMVGPGMTDEVLQRIRESLFTTKSFGTGLGVPAIEQIVIQHGGTLSIDPAQGQGATITVALPLTHSILQLGEAA